MLSLLLLLACTGADDSGADDTGIPGTPGPGSLSLTFRMDDDYIADMAEPPVGTFRGSIYAEADASAVGPVDGAEPLLDIAVEGIDLSDGGGPTTAPFETEALDPQVVWVLGCLDSDGNDCDQGDPITVPNENKVEVAADTSTPFEVYLGMLNPS